MFKKLSLLIFVVFAFISLGVNCKKSTLKVTTEELKVGYVGIYYVDSLDAESGNKPYSWSIIDGTLPSGLKLARQGIIYGTPSEEGDWTFTVQVTDEDNSTADKRLSITILPFGGGKESERRAEVSRKSEESPHMSNSQQVRRKMHKGGTLVFEDDFDSGLSSWNHFGDPSPKAFYSSEFEDGWGYSTEGDGWYQSGSWSKTFFNMKSKLIIEFRLKQPAGHTWDLISVGIGLMQTGYREDNHPAYFGIGVCGIAPDGNAELSNAIRYFALKTSNGKRRYNSFVEYHANDHKFHIYKIIYDPVSRKVEFYKDGALITTLDIAPPPYDKLPLRIEGRGAHAHNYLDYIRVYEVESRGEEISIDLNRGLIAYWSFDDCTARDNSGNGYDGMIYGNPRCVKGVKGNAFYFDGIEDWINLGFYPDFKLREWTIALWVKVNKMPSTEVTLIGREEDINGKYNFWIGVDYRGFIRSQYETCDDEYDHNLFSKPISPGKWYFVASVRNRETGEHSLYINGVKVDQKYWHDVPCLNNEEIWIAHRGYGDKLYFDGILDEIRIYNRALTEDEIRRLYENR